MEAKELTKEEEAEFTVFNAAAYDLYRKSEADENREAPCWLCISKESKVELGKRFLVWARENLLPNQVISDENIKQMINRSTVGPALFLWKRMELEAKALRVQGGNPHAYFHPIK